MSIILIWFSPVADAPVTGSRIDLELLSFRSSKKRPLTKEQKKHNAQQAWERVVVEHVNRQCKLLRIVKDSYRGKHKDYGLNWNLVAPINNLKLARQHLNKATP